MVAQETPNLLAGVRFSHGIPILYKVISMNLFPTICIDDFYDDPDSIRNYALSLEYFTSTGEYPGKRTKSLHEIDKVFFDDFCEKIMSIYYNFDTTLMNWNISTRFQLIENLSDNKSSPKNTGWIHQDGAALLGGIIYLTPEIDPSCGTSVFKLKDSIEHDTGDLTIRTDFHSKNIDRDYDCNIVKHNSQFVETIRFDNHYNRLIAFEGGVFHGVNNFYSNKQRLTQVFFVHNIESNCRSPIERMKIIKR